MKRLILPLMALTFLAGACSSTPKSATKPSLESLGTRSTAWGVLPTYNVPGQRFAFVRLPRLNEDSFTPKSVTLDVLINADGSVEDATVTTSSGDPMTDFAVLASFIGASYSLQPGDDYPAPFVVQQKMTVNPESMRGMAYANAYGPFGQQSSMPPAGAPFHQAWSGAGGGWSGGGNFSNSSSSSSSSGK
jgi:TonB family protein